MQITNCNYTHNSRNTKSFAGIRSVKCEGLYKKYPNLGKELVDTFKNNPKAMDFCKKYDVDIIFRAVKDGLNGVKSAICVFYDDISKSKFKKFFGSIGRSDDKVIIHGWGSNYNSDGGIKEATETLKAAISPENRNSKFSTGVLDMHLQIAEEKIQEAIAKKALEKQTKMAAIQYKKQAQVSNISDKSMLDDSIKDLIDKSF